MGIIGKLLKWPAVKKASSHHRVFFGKTKHRDEMKGPEGEATTATLEFKVG